MLIETKAYEQLVEKVEELTAKVTMLAERLNRPEPAVWLTASEVCQTLNISKRTLQYYRDTGVIPYSSVARKTYYKAAKIMAILTAHTNRTKF